MKKLLNLTIMYLLLITSSFAQVENLDLKANLTSTYSHGGRNGGFDLEVAINRVLLQIGAFVISPKGIEIYPEFNPKFIKDFIDQIQVTTTIETISVKGEPRTCDNDPISKELRCNVEAISKYFKVDLTPQEKAIFVVTLAHEIFSMMGYELGYEKIVSNYQFSSRLMPHASLILDFPIGEAEIRPEFFGLESKSYGYTLVNRKTNDTIRLICLNDNVDIHRCKNYALVSNANGMQQPLVPEKTKITPQSLAELSKKKFKAQDLEDFEAELLHIKSKGYKFLSLKGAIGDEYRFGYGVLQHIFGGAYWKSSYSNTFADIAITSSITLLVGGLITAIYTPVGWALIVALPVSDVVTEAGKQVINTVIYPVKALISTIKVAKTKKNIKKIKSKLNNAYDVLNLDRKLSLVGKTKRVSDKEFEFIKNYLINFVNTVK